MKKLLKSKTIHCEKRFGTQEECIEYCSKDKTRILGPWTLGVKTPGQGHRLDVVETELLFRNSNKCVKTLIKKGIEVKGIEVAKGNTRL